MYKEPLQSVKPVGLELIFLYPCPFCAHQVPTLSPTQPAEIQCESCARKFPILPVDEKTVVYIKTVLANGASAVDPAFL